MMLKIKNRLYVATLSIAVLAAPMIANAAATSVPHAKIMQHGSMMSAGKATAAGKSRAGMAHGNMAGMMGMMAMMNACTRAMNTMANNNAHGAMMGKSIPKKS